MVWSNEKLILMCVDAFSLQGNFLPTFSCVLSQLTGQHPTAPIPSAWASFTQFTKFLIKNPGNFLQAPLSRILPLACRPTWQDIPDNSRAIHQFY
jgi:hypothetical protein